MRSVLQCFEISLPLAAKAENGHLATEQHELLVKERDSESRNQFRSDSDNRSHASGLSSHPSQSSSSYSRSRRGSLDRLVYPRQNLSSIGMLGKAVYDISSYQWESTHDNIILSLEIMILGDYTC